MDRPRPSNINFESLLYQEESSSVYDFVKSVFTGTNIQ